MSMSKFFQNFLTVYLPQMGVKKSSCHETRETVEPEDDDPKIQKTDSEVVSSDDECNSIASSNMEICGEIDYQDFEICDEGTAKVVRKGNVYDLLPSECDGSFGVNHWLCKVPSVQSVVSKQVVESTNDKQNDPIQKLSKEDCKTTAVSGEEVKSRPILLIPVNLCGNGKREICIEKSTSKKDSIITSLEAEKLVATKENFLPSVPNSTNNALLNTSEGVNTNIDDCVGKTQEPPMKTIQSYTNGITDRRQLLRKTDGKVNNETHVPTFQLRSQVKSDHCSDEMQGETAQKHVLSSSKSTAFSDQLPDNDDHVYNNGCSLQLENSQLMEKLSPPMMPDEFMTASCIVFEDEIPSPEESQCSTTIQTLISTENANYTKEVPYHVSNDRGPSSSLCSDDGSFLSSKLPPGSTLFNSQGVFRTIDREKPFMCGFCGETSDKYDVLNRHIALQHETLEKRYACEICGRRFAQPWNLATHARQHAQERPFACDQCGCRFKFQSILRRHTSTHTKDKPFSCKICHRSFESQSFLLFKHSKLHKEEKGSVICNICKMRFSHHCHLKRHMRRYDGQKAFKCSFCDIQFHLEIHLQQHMITHKKTMELDALDIEANRLSMADLDTAPSYTNGRIVGALRNSSYDLLNNVVSESKVMTVQEPRTSNSLETTSNQTQGDGYSTRAMNRKRVSLASGIVYEDEVSTPESLQFYSTTTQTLLSEAGKEHPLSSSRQSVDDGKSSSFRNHVQSIVASKPPHDDAFRRSQHVVYTKGKEKPFSCGICGKAYKIRHSVFGHIVLHHEEKRYSCEFCGKRFARPSDLAKHVRIHTLEKPFSCDQCGKQFRCDSDLRKHKFTHSKERLFHCDQCNKSYKSKTGLSWHKESHKEEEQKKGVTCDVCKRKCSRPSELKRHLMIHTGEKPFKCTLCKKQFCTKLLLHNHMNSHNGKKRLAKDPCSICGKTLWATRIPDHMRMHAGVKPFECNICGKRFPKKPNLEGHMRSHTGEKPFACDRCDKRFTLYSNMVTHKAKCAVLQETIA